MYTALRPNPTKGTTMKRAIFVALTATAILCGCGTTEQQVTTVVRDASVSGPLFSPAVNPVSDYAKESVTISAHFSGPRKSSFDGVIVGSEPGRSTWLYPADTVRLSGGGVSLQRQVPRYNLSWKVPSFSTGLNVDFAWKSTALSFGGSLSNVNGRTLYGWSAGFGIFTGESRNARARFDLGVFGQSLYYDARSVTVTTTTTSWLFGSPTTTVDTAFYHDIKTQSSIGYYGTVTVNSAVPSWPVNFFLQGSLVSQPILHYKPYTRTTVNWLFLLPVESTESQGEVETNALMLGVTPGIYIEPSNSMIMLVGVRCLFDASETFTGETSMIMPFVQVGLRTGL